jgi:DNA invertase Pin-like site-specific DNA recombinase
MSTATNRRRVRVDGYIRVSSTRDLHAGGKKQDPNSPEWQRERIETFCQLHKLELVKIHEEPDVSGGTYNRKHLAELMRRIRDGETGGVVVMALDRFGRSTVGGLKLVDEIREGGGVFYAVEQGLDAEDENADLLMPLYFGIAQRELRRIKKNWEKAADKAVSNNRRMGAPPIGYLRSNSYGDEHGLTNRPGPTGKLVPDPVYAPVVTGIFERRAAGWGWIPISEWAMSQVPTVPSGAPWSLAGCRYIVKSRTYLGEYNWGSRQLVAAHEPLVDPVTWERAQRPGQRFGGNGAATVRMLSGVARCAGCRSTMTVNRVNGRVPYYVCRNASTRKHVCAGPTSIVAETLERHVEEEILRLLGELRFGRAKDDRLLRTLQAKAAQAESDLDGWMAPEVQRALEPVLWARGLAERQGALDDARAELLAEQERLDPLVAGFDVGDLIARWGAGDLTASEQNLVARQVLQAVFVRATDARGPRARSSGAIADRIYVAPAGSGIDLPHPPKRFDWRPFAW